MWTSFLLLMVKIRISNSDKKRRTNCTVVICYLWSKSSYLTEKRKGMYSCYLLLVVNAMVRVGECPPVITLCPAAIILPELMFYSGIFNIQTRNMPQILQECFCKAIGFVWQIREGSWLLICSRLQVFRDVGMGTLTLIGLGPSPRKTG